MGDRSALVVLEEVRARLRSVPGFETGHGLPHLGYENGTLTIEGEVDGVGTKKRMLRVAWWVPGVRDVVNGIAVEPPEEDSDGAIADACRIALEKDPFVDASQIRISVRDRRVTLGGLVPSEDQRRMAENDMWALFGVDAVDNEIRVHR